MHSVYYYNMQSHRLDRNRLERWLKFSSTTTTTTTTIRCCNKSQDWKRETDKFWPAGIEIALQTFTHLSLLGTRWCGQRVASVGRLKHFYFKFNLAWPFHLDNEAYLETRVLKLKISWNFEDRNFASLDETRYFVRGKCQGSKCTQFVLVDWWHQRQLEAPKQSDRLFERNRRGERSNVDSCSWSMLRSRKNKISCEWEKQK